MEEPKNIAIVHDWLVSMRGGERVLEVLCEMFPAATLFTLVHRAGSASPPIERMKIVPSFVQHLPRAETRYQYYLPLFPAAFGSFDLRGFDLVISSSSSSAKGIRPRNGCLHICYCHTPMRYIWDQYEQYFGPGRSPVPVRAAMFFLRDFLQRWDVRTSRTVDRFIANSRYVQERISRIYSRDSEVLYPPVDTGRFSLSDENDGYYLVLSALVPYKRIDIAVEAFSTLKERLIVIGTGSEERRLKAAATSNVEFVGYVPDAEVTRYLRRCRALILPGEEDFGIAPVEAMACGKPVIAYGKGGVRETVLDGITGILFAEQSASSLRHALQTFRGTSFDPGRMRAHAEKFDEASFRENLGHLIARWWDDCRRR